MDASSPPFTTADYSFLTAPVDQDLYLPSYSPNYDMLPVSDAAPEYPTSLSLPPSMHYYPTFTPSLPKSTRSFSPADGISPHDLSAGSGGPRRRDSSGSNTGSPASSHGGTFVHRRPRTATLTSSPTGMSNASLRNRKRRMATIDDDFCSDDDMDAPLPLSSNNEVVVQKRREDIRRQRIESEQRRRDELRDGFRKLKDVLPVTNQKPSKVSLLDRATQHIKLLEATQRQMNAKMLELEAETSRLRTMNETLMLSTAAATVERRQAAAGPPPAY